ncbi:hypothetical protein RUND412_008509 [Rhizina undulata]
MKAKTYSALQKTYDQSFLTCSTAVYYEGQGNETEALRCWQECLSQLQGHNCPAHRPRSDTEKELLRSLKKMQDQCQERVLLLQAILLSKTEAENRTAKERGRSRRNSGLQINGAAASSASTPGVPFSPLVVPQFPERPRTASNVSHSLPYPSNFPPVFQSAVTPPPGMPSKISRSPSPDKRTLLSTLRPAGKQKKRESFIRRDSSGTAAAQAATLAWSSITRTDGGELSRTLTAPSAESLSIRPSTSASPSTANPHNRERSSSIPGRHPSPQETSTTRPRLSRAKPRPHSSVLFLGGPSYSPPYSPPETPPAPPPHRHHVANDDSPRGPRQFPNPPTESRPRRSCDLERAVSRKPVPPPVPPKIPPLPAVKPARLSHMRASASVSNVAPLIYSDTNRSRTFPKPGVSRRRTTETLASTNSSVNSWCSAEAHSEDSISNEDRDSQSLFESDKDSDEQIWKEKLEKILKTLHKGVDQEAARQVANEIVVKGDEVHWSDVAGLEAAKSALKEAVVYPFLRPDLFSGLREPARGMLLFGPPGTGKTMLARAVATESKSTFFSISASSLTSKYLGESEKLVRALFAMAKAMAPSIIFVDEIDSLLSSRSGTGEHEATRRIKTEFLIQWSDLARAAAGKESAGGDASRVLVLAATNLPWAIDEAARRRFVRRQYIPLPEDTTRQKQLRNLLKSQKHQMSEDDMNRLVYLTEGFSGSDITALAKDAAMGPLRSLGEALLHMKMDDIRPIAFKDFEASLITIRPSVSKEGLQAFEDWARQYGERV